MKILKAILGVLKAILWFVLKLILGLVGIVVGVLFLAYVAIFLTAIGTLIFDGSEAFINYIVYQKEILIVGTVVCVISVVVALVENAEEKPKVKPRSTYSTGYSGSSSYSGSHSSDLGAASSGSAWDDDYADMLGRAMKITETYGEDWKGYDPEAPSSDSDYY